MNFKHQINSNVQCSHYSYFIYIYIFIKLKVIFKRCSEKEKDVQLYSLHPPPHLVPFQASSEEHVLPFLPMSSLTGPMIIPIIVINSFI